MHGATIKIMFIYLDKKSHYNKKKTQLATDWTVRYSNPDEGEIFLTRPYRPCGSPNLTEHRLSLSIIGDRAVRRLGEPQRASGLCSEDMSPSSVQKYVYIDEMF